MKRLIAPLLLVSLFAACAQQKGATALQPPKALALADITVRDPFIFADAKTKTYHLIASGNLGVREYSSTDLIHWSDPVEIFKVTEGLWGANKITAVWAPEMHFYQGKYYLFATFSTTTPLADQSPPTKPALSKQPLIMRGTATLVADRIQGPFRAMQDHAIAPADIMSLDGTLWVEDGKPYMVYAHEWVQVANGTMEAIELKPDLSSAAGPPLKLFSAGDAPWAKIQAEGGTVTDGPFLYRGTTGKLYMVWSSFNAQGKYNVGIAISSTGKLAGPWKQQAEPLYTNHGGHSMLFHTFDGKLMMALHQPNNGGPAHAHLFETIDTGETLMLGKEFSPAP